MTNIEKLGKICIEAIKDKSVEEQMKIVSLQCQLEKDLDKLEHIKVLVEKYNNDELHFTRGFDFINIVKEVLKND